MATGGVSVVVLILCIRHADVLLWSVHTLHSTTYISGQWCSVQLALLISYVLYRRLSRSGGYALLDIYWLSVDHGPQSSMLEKYFGSFGGLVQCDISCLVKTSPV